MDHFDRALQAALRSGGAKLLVRRAGNLLSIYLQKQAGCGGKLWMTNSSKLDAYSDGKNFVVTTGIGRLARSTDEIAFVIAHEMAHNILGHSRKSSKHGIFGLFHARRDEIEADRYAVRLMANAGYRPVGGITFLQAARRRLWWNVSLDHPGFGRRIRVVSAAMKANGGS
jgi:predicted Zn-dependent protease